MVLIVVMGLVIVAPSYGAIDSYGVVVVIIA